MTLVSRSWFRPLHSVLGPPPLEMHAKVARLSVLFEDLRLELVGASEDSLPVLAAIGEAHRRNYFIRRSIATLVEFIGALTMLDQDRDFRSVKARFDTQGTLDWAEAITFLKANKTFIKDLRDDFGGHFGYSAAKYAVEHLDPGTVESIEIHRRPLEDKAGPKLKFAGELAAIAMARHRGALSSREHFEHMITTALGCYERCTGCMHLVVRFYLMNRFAPN